MTDRETLDEAKLLFVGQTQGDLLAREVIEIAGRHQKQSDALSARVDELAHELLETARMLQESQSLIVTLATEKPRPRP